MPLEMKVISLARQTMQQLLTICRLEVIPLYCRLLLMARNNTTMLFVYLRTTLMSWKHVLGKNLWRYLLFFGN